jgi:hypothetical protein
MPESTVVKQRTDKTAAFIRYFGGSQVNMGLIYYIGRDKRNNV